MYLENYVLYNIIYNNIIFNGSHGIFLRGMNNTIHNNLIYNTANGIVCQKINDSLFYNNRLLDNGVGIDILWMHHNNFYSNIFSEGSVYIIGSQDNIFTNNNFTKNSIFGLYMSDTNDNLLNNNTFEYSGGDGVFTADSSDTYYDNVFRNNTLSSYESMGNNHWNLTNLGNYWDDFSSNPGYPNYYEIPGPGDGIDWHPQ